MTRQKVYSVIDAERIKQGAVWRTNREIEKQYSYSPPHILLLEEQVIKLRQEWYAALDESGLTERFIKIAAIAVRALEEITATK